MENLSFIPTAEKVTVENYPYSFSLRTTLFDTIDFDPKKGYRHVTQTINPKNGSLNKPKKSTYYHFMLRYKNDVGHIKIFYIDFNKSFEDMNSVSEKIINVWEYLTNEEKQYLIITFKTFLKVSVYAGIQYAGINEDIIINEYKKLTNYINNFGNIEEKKIKGVLKKVIVSYNTDTNLFLNLPKIDIEKIKEATPEKYNPFTVKSHTIG